MRSLLSGASPWTFYFIGFVLALLLTLLAFGLVTFGEGLSRQWVVGGVLGLAIVQILVHLRCFLHLGFGASQRWNVLTLLFTLVIIVILAGGTLWILHNLNYWMK